MSKYGKIYGAKRTGTNYLRKVLYDNFLSLEIFMNVGGWKHGKIVEFPNKHNLLNRVDSITKKTIAIDKTIHLFETNKVLFIVCIKNPYMWIQSIIDYALYKNIKKEDIDEVFIMKEVEGWNILYRNYRMFIEKGKAELIKYEELLEDPKGILVNLSKKRNWEIINEDSLKLSTKYMSANPDNVIGGHRGVNFDKAKYLKPDIKKVLSKNTIKIINDNIDLSLLEFYKYEIVYL